MKQNISVLILTVVIFGLSANVNAGHHETGDAATEEHKGKKYKHKHRKSPARMLKKVDTNQDGQVDLTEFLAHAEQRFNKMDLNSDGILTLEEGKESHKLMREKHKAERKARREQRKAEREATGANEERD
jgi:hypothetical protein